MRGREGVTVVEEVFLPLRIRRLFFLFSLSLTSKVLLIKRCKVYWFLECG